jgi:Flp pilus assembly protein TadD
MARKTTAITPPSTDISAADLNEGKLKLTGRVPQVVNNLGYSQYLRGNKKKAKELLLEAKAGMADTTVVDANLPLLKGLRQGFLYAARIVGMPLTSIFRSACHAS